MFFRNSSTVKPYDLKNSKQELIEAHEDLGFLKPNAEQALDIADLLKEINEMHDEIEHFSTITDTSKFKEELEDASVDEAFFQSLLSDTVTKFPDKSACRLAKSVAEKIMENYVRTRDQLNSLKQQACRYSLYGRSI